MRSSVLPAMALCLLMNVTAKAQEAQIDKEKLVTLLNEARGKACNCGLVPMQAVAPVIWNAQLEQAALAHSSYMNANNVFAHKGQNGSNVGARITQQGYIWRSCGENLGKGYQTEEDIVKGWMGSPDHCKNIMNGTFKEVGVAKVGLLWTAVFALKKEPVAPQAAPAATQ